MFNTKSNSKFGIIHITFTTFLYVLFIVFKSFLVLIFMARSVLFMHYAGSLVLFWRCFGLQRSYLFLSLIIIIKRKIVDLFLLVGGLQV